MAEQNEELEELGSTILELDEKTLAELRSNGFLLVAFPGGNAKLALLGLSDAIVYKFTGSNYPDVDELHTHIVSGKTVILMKTSYPSRYDIYHLEYRNSGSGRIALTFTNGNKRLIYDGYNWQEKQAEFIGKVASGGELTDSASINVPNNSFSTLVTRQSSLVLNVNTEYHDIPNFAVEITTTTNTTLSVTRTFGNTVETLKHSVSAGNRLESGKTYQVTVVGDCWTMAEFEA